jgi:hypothetical protein
MSARRIALLVLLGSCLAPAGADAGVSRLYTVSLSGTMRAELTRVFPLTPPDGCQGDGRRTQRFLASARMVPRPRPARLGFGTARIDFTARLASRTASAEEETSGTFTPVPGGDGCTFTPQRTPAGCGFAPSATDANGVRFSVEVFFATFVLRQRQFGVVQCRPNPLDGDLFLTRARTRLSVRGVTRLRVGRSLSASGAVTEAPTSGVRVTGGQRTTYRITVRRVR